MFFLIIIVFDLTQMNVLYLIPILSKEHFFVPLILSKYQEIEIVWVPMDSLLLLKFFKSCNAFYHDSMIFTPRELFTYVVIIKLIILMLSKLILQMVCISFSAIVITVTPLIVAIRRGGLSPLFPAVTRTVSIWPSELFVYLNSK